ncbi:polyphosphate:AMP phosphotransferase [Funiculus sociatus GB2-A5]|uniref:Polyphosphate:AMP phosphotransferase n=1 Tax=Funiculus sociatus GB2-A5 TaxID=2933946 RepID=A0ABV0JHD9_9CYAN|nr:MULTISPECIES: polyphosphate:AMP phosphotransferase [unclassified Trichocoleus]MBD1908798.1 polyphosphate:AMP phosphotransferase [Trichocoleus sp. FACHB-832]MBD2064289.1 polyphosphate:AMP phosphotransferase [Trichocoleus sp. FACHB-6]
MLDTLDLERSLDKSTYKSQMETLMRSLRSLQKSCWEKKLPMIVVLEGWAAAGKGSLVKKMVNYMDPRGFTVHPIWPPNEQEQQYPFLWRFWQKLPSKGSIGIFYHSWYTRVLEDRLFERVSSGEIPTVISQINAFERQLVDDGSAIAKFWIHLGRKELKHRLKKYAADPLEAWRVRPEDWQQEKRYDQYINYAEEMLVQTSTGPAPWTLVEGNCQRFSRVKVLTQMAATLTEALDRLHIQAPVIPALPPQEHLNPAEPNLLARVDLNLCLSKDEYKQQLRHEQVEMRKLQMKIHEAQVPVLVLFEGWDAAGKGGAIKRLTDALDPRSYIVHPFAAPTDEEKAHHYLWRFWRWLPTAGTIGIFDRSWYGRVLVERVEGFATEREWHRAYQEINEFEAQLTSAGYVLVKFWLHLSPEEQLKRFCDRQNDSFKQYKLTDEDWRNREKWSLYEVAVNQAIQRTSTPNAPWTIIAANDKYYARVKVIQSVAEAIHSQLKRR